MGFGTALSGGFPCSFIVLKIILRHLGCPNVFGLVNGA